MDATAVPAPAADLHADVVGSLLRPGRLVRARECCARGELTSGEFKRLEDRAVDEAVALQEEAGLPVVTDGEMRRLSFQSQLPEAVDGFGRFDLDAFLWGEWFGDAAVGDRSRERPSQLGVERRLRWRRHLCAEEFTYLRARAGAVAKVSLPSPSLWASFWSPERSAGAYATLDDFLSHVAQILRAEVEELIRLGATYIQLDAPHYPLLADPRTRGFYESRGWTVERWLDAGADLDNAVTGGHPPSVTFGFHLCRGNQESRWLAAGDYDLLARRLLPRLHAHRLLLEYDDPRSGGFEPLRHVPDDRLVVLGLVSTKTGRLESASALAARVREAARFHPLDRLALSPQCGFASSVVGNRISPGDQRRKLQLVARVAGDLWG